MTQAEWLDQTRPTALLYPLLFLRVKAFALTWFGLKSRELSERKLRLFVCGCARQVWGGLSDEGRQLVELCERQADGLATPDEIKAARQVVTEEDDLTVQVAQVALAPSPWLPFQFDGGGWPADLAARAARLLKGCPGDDDLDQCDLLRDVFTPFQPPHPDPSWLSWREGLVPKMAALIYDGRRFGELPILADALEEAGCTDAAYLDHCRAGKEHIRGCWVLDALLGKG